LPGSPVRRESGGSRQRVGDPNVRRTTAAGPGGSRHRRPTRRSRAQIRPTSWRSERGRSVRWQSPDDCPLVLGPVCAATGSVRRGRVRPDTAPPGSGGRPDNFVQRFHHGSLSSVLRRRSWLVQRALNSR